MDEIVNKLLRGGCRPDEVEVEARIRRQLVSRHSALQLIAFHGPDWQVSQYSERRKISKNNRKCTYRSRIGSTSTYICKSSIAKEDVLDMWCTVHVSVETQMPAMQRSLNAISPVEIVRHRTVMNGHYIDIVFGDETRVEVETCDTSEFDLSAMLEVVKYVCRLLQGNKEFLGYYDWRTVMHVSGTLFGPFCIDKKRFQKPRTLTMDVLGNIAKNVGKWVVTPKVDGVRRFLVIANGEVYSLGTAKEVAHQISMAWLEGVTILDCEYAYDMFHAFDIPVYDGEYCGNKPFHEMTYVVEDVVKQLADSGLNIQAKPYEAFSSFDKLKQLYEQFDKEFRIDGLIFYDVHDNYMQPVPKWKTHSTVDLEVRNSRLFTCDEYRVNMQHADLPDDAFGIWEFSYADDTLTAKRSRPDKPQANSMSIVEKNMFGSVPGTLFSGKGCYLMRKYHNRVKNRLIREADDFKATFMDIGTGQGGDVQKWSRASKVFCVEPDSDCFDEIERRRDSAGISADIVALNNRLEDVDLDSIDNKVDIITAFFCMNQWSKTDWDMLANLIKTKGSKHCRLLAIAMTEPKEHRSNIFKIVMRGPDKYNIKMYDTRIMDINETAVLSSNLTELMKTCEMKLIRKDKLDENDFMTPCERRLSSMYSLFVYKRN